MKVLTLIFVSLSILELFANARDYCDLDDCPPSLPRDDGICSILRLKSKGFELCCRYEHGKVSYKKGFVPTSKFKSCHGHCNDNAINSSCWRCMGCVNLEILKTTFSPTRLDLSTISSFKYVSKQPPITRKMTNGKSKSLKAVIIILSAVIGVLIICVVILVLCSRRKSKTESETREIEQKADTGSQKETLLLVNKGTLEV